MSPEADDSDNDFDGLTKEEVKKEVAERIKRKQQETIDLFTSGELSLSLLIQMAAAEGSALNRITISKMLNSLPDSTPDDVRYALMTTGVKGNTWLSKLSPDVGTTLITRLEDARNGAREALQRFPFWDSADPQAALADETIAAIGQE